MFGNEMRDQPRLPYGDLHPRRRGGTRVLLGVAALLPLLVVATFGWRTFLGSEPSPPPPPAIQESGESVAAAAVPSTIEVIEPEPLPPNARLPEPASAAPPLALGLLPPAELTATSIVVLDGASLEVLFEQNARMRRAPASLTKIATAIVAAEHGNLDDLAVSNLHHWDVGHDSTVMGLEPGDIVSVRNLLYGLMLVSGNDAAIVIAEHLAGSERAFVREMNELAERLGLRDTQFRNTHGLTEDGHYSTAYDLAILTRHLMSYPELREIVGTEQTIVTGVRAGETIEFSFYNHNPLLNYTPGVDGVKTGFTEEAGRTFAASAERDGRRVYIVVLDAPHRAHDTIALIEWAYEAFLWEPE